jgi:hypothetical protein
MTSGDAGLPGRAAGPRFKHQLVIGRCFETELSRTAEAEHALCVRVLVKLFISAIHIGIKDLHFGTCALSRPRNMALRKSLTFAARSVSDRGHRVRHVTWRAAKAQGLTKII